MFVTSRRSSRALGVVLAIVAVLAVASPGRAQTATPASPGASSDGADEGPQRSSFDRALRTAGDGRVTLTVELDVGWHPEPELSAGAAGAQRQAIAQRFAEVVRALRGTDHRLIHPPRAIPHATFELGADAIEVLGAIDAVADVWEPPRAGTFLDTTVPLVDADSAHRAGLAGSGHAVAVIDTGVDRSHPFFGKRIVREACFSESSDCPNGKTRETGSGSGAPCPYGTGCAHGTHVAGIAAGGPAADGTVGVAPDAPIIAINAASRDPLGQQGFSGADIVAALEHVYALRGKLDVASVNLSLGGGAYPAPCDGVVYPPYDDAVAQLDAAGISVVAASGNAELTAATAWPACHSGTISVGATTDADRVAQYSNSADHLDLLAPGHEVTSAVPGGGYAVFSGTSMAAPHVAGAIAVLRSGLPDATPNAILTSLRDGGVPVRDDRAGAGDRVRPRLDVRVALIDLGYPPPNTSITDAPPTRSTSSTARFAFRSDAVAPRFQCRLDGGSWRGCTSPRAYTGLSLGTHEFDVRAVDQLGQRDPTPARVRWTIEMGFIDTAGHTFRAEIERLAAAGVTKGCDRAGTRFCPNDPVTRGQMAAFLNRALGLPSGSVTFTDTRGHIFEGDISRLAAAGVTKGCNAAGTRFCPNDPVTRGQMAAFLVRAGLTD